MKDYQENIIPPFNQNEGDNFLYENPDSKVRIIFAGNSIAKHAPRPESGWLNDCGMAASSIDKDYVHLIAKKIKEYDPNVSFGIAQVAAHERRFFTEEPSLNYKPSHDFNANIVIMFYGANVSKDYDTMENPPKTFAQGYEDMRNYLSHDGKAAVFHSMGFYIRPNLDEEKKQVADKYGDPFIDISDIRSRDDSHGRFNHPSDEGMAAIADRFWEYIEPIVKDLTK